jgi:hypothetical protein
MERTNFYRLDDGSFRNEAGTLVYMTADRFIKDIVQGECCFICGMSPSQTKFNDEHVVPDWILRRYNLQDKVIDLPNEEGYTYAKYKIPCCEPCNSQMSVVFEGPMRTLIDQGFAAVIKASSRDERMRLFVWLTLIFLKAHLKDRLLPYHLDRRKGDGMIADVYAWEKLHHLHCVARTFLTHCGFHNTAFGSLIISPAVCDPAFERFDLVTRYESQSILIRMDDVAIFAVLNDSGATGSSYATKLQRISAPLTPVQLREVFVDLSCISAHLENRPKFTTHFEPERGRLLIAADPGPPVAAMRVNRSEFGDLIYRYCAPLIAEQVAADDLEKLKSGMVSFLFRADGSFIDQSRPPSGGTANSEASAS